MRDRSRRRDQVDATAAAVDATEEEGEEGGAKDGKEAGEADGYEPEVRSRRKNNNNNKEK